MQIERYLPTVTIAFKFAVANRIPYMLQVTGEILQVSVLYFIWRAAYAQADSFGGLNRSQMVTYLFVAQFFRVIVSYGLIENQIAQWIRSGDLIREQVVPLVHLWKDFCMCVGWLLAVDCFSGGLLIAGASSSSAWRHRSRSTCQRWPSACCWRSRSASASAT